MASAVTSKCFAPPWRCHNCVRKFNYIFQEGKKESKLHKFAVQEVNRKAKDKENKIKSDSISKCEDSNEKVEIGVEKMCIGEVSDVKEIEEEVEIEIKSECDDSKGKYDKGEKEKKGKVDKIMEKVTLKADMDNKREDPSKDEKLSSETKMNNKEEEIVEKDKSKGSRSEAEGSTEKESSNRLKTEIEQIKVKSKDNESKIGTEQMEEKGMDNESKTGNEQMEKKDKDKESKTGNEQMEEKDKDNESKTGNEQMEENDKDKESQTGNEQLEGKEKDKDNESKIGCEEMKEKEEYKRCSGCFLMTYCDRSCQLEHWEHVHRYHCYYLSGKKKIKEDSCDEWAKYNEPGNNSEIYDINSPKIGCVPCYTEAESKLMRVKLGHLFGYHRCNSSCNCSIQHPYPHPFPMGEISGKLVCTGLDELLNHANILCKAIITKMMNAKVKDKKTIDLVGKLGEQIRHSKMMLWMSILTFGTIISNNIFEINNEDIKNKLDGIFDSANAWWEALYYTLGMILKVSDSQEFVFNLDPSSFKDSGFTRFIEDQKDQIRNVSFVSENKLWHRFKLWPTMDRFPISDAPRSRSSNRRSKAVAKTNKQSLVLRLPKDVHCESCSKDLSGKSLTAKDSLNLCPILLSRVAQNGKLAACCSKEVNATCTQDHIRKHDITDEDYTDEVKKEVEDFGKKARVCQLCLKKSKGSHRCANCHSVQYCSVECSKKDFKFHTTVCNTWAKDPMKKIMSKKKQRNWSKDGPV